MFVRIVMLTALAFSLDLVSSLASAQQPQPKSKPAARPASPATEAPKSKVQLPIGTKEGIPSKQEILNSPQWRRAMFEFAEWLSAQPIYDKQQVAEIKQRFNQQVAKASPEELVALLADMQAKFQIIETPAAKEARAWMGQYLSVMSDKKRAEVLKQMPNLVTMTADQMAAEISSLQAKKANLDAEQEAFQRGQQQLVANQIQNDRTAQQNFIHDWNSPPMSYSPYRGNSNVNERLNNAPTGSGMGFYVSPWGGVGMTFSPSSW